MSAPSSEQRRGGLQDKDPFSPAVTLWRPVKPTGMNAAFFSRHGDHTRPPARSGGVTQGRRVSPEPPIAELDLRGPLSYLGQDKRGHVGFRGGAGTAQAAAAFRQNSLQKHQNTIAAVLHQLHSQPVAALLENASSPEPTRSSKVKILNNAAGSD